MLFLQLIMRKLRRPGFGSARGGRAAVIVPNGTLFATGVGSRIKEELLREYNLHTVVRMPKGVFEPYTQIETNVLFFDRTGPTRQVWYYEQPLPEGRKNYTMTTPIRFEEFYSCMKWWNLREENQHAWKVSAEELLTSGANLDVRNPRSKEDIEHMPPEQLVEDILYKERQILEILEDLKQGFGAV